MSTYVSRFIEVKSNDGKWVLLKFYYPFGHNYYRNPDIEIGDMKLNTFTHICNNACTLREYLHNNGWGCFNGCSFGNRGFPDDMSDELKSILNKEIEGSERDYRYNKSYCTLNELWALYESEMSKIKNDLFKTIYEYQYKAVNQKLDRLLELSFADKSTLEKIEKEEKKTKKLLSKKKKDDEDETTFEGELEWVKEDYDNIQSIKNEYNFIWRLVDEIFGYKDDNEIRIVYYFE